MSSSQIPNEEDHEATTNSRSSLPPISSTLPSLPPPTGSSSSLPSSAPVPRSSTQSEGTFISSSSSEGGPQILDGGADASASQNSILQFWREQTEKIEKSTNLKSHGLPLQRIKRIMKSDEEIKMISAETPALFAKACELFILELTLRAWEHTEEGKRKTLQRSDISAAISRTDTYDFLIDIIPREDMKSPTKKIDDSSRPPLQQFSLGAQPDGYHNLFFQNQHHHPQPSMMNSQQPQPYQQPPNTRYGYYFPQHQQAQQGLPQNIHPEHFMHPRMHPGPIPGQMHQGQMHQGQMHQGQIHQGQQLHQAQAPYYAEQEEEPNYPNM